MNIKDRPTQYILRNGVRFQIKRNNSHIYEINETFVDGAYRQSGAKISSGVTVIDIGANIGVFSIYMATKIKGLYVYAYEPAPENFELLEKNIELNQLHCIKPFRQAVASKREKRKLYITQMSSTHSLSPLQFEKGISEDVLKNHKNPEILEIDCITLEDIFKENKLNNCDLLKIDTEGAEDEILLSTPLEIMRRIRNMQFEYHFTHHTMDEFGKLLDFLQKIGFRFEVTLRLPANALVLACLRN